MAHPGSGTPPPASLPYRSASAVITSVMSALTAHDWSGTENLPSRGGYVVAANHISYADPLALAHFLLRHNVEPYFLGKASLFHVPLVGRWLQAAGQIPVYRGTDRAGEALTHAVDALRAGNNIVVMPESTITRDPEGWPMQAKTGVVRLALAAQVPIVPVAQWGAHRLMPRGAMVPRLWPRPTMTMRVGPPLGRAELGLDAASLSRDDVDREALHHATDRVMDSITSVLESVRGQSAPLGRWDPHLNRRVGRADPSPRPLPEEGEHP